MRTTASWSIPVIALQPLARFYHCLDTILQHRRLFSSLYRAQSNQKLSRRLGDAEWVKVATLLIAGRQVYFRQRVKRVLGSKLSTNYANIAAILVEWAAIYTCFLVGFVATLAINNPVVNVFATSVGQVQVSVNEIEPNE